MASTHDHELVDDVLQEILLRLPPASVLRSRAVCKQWRSITTSPAFVAAYSLGRPPELLVYPDGYKMARGSQNILAALDLVNSGDYAAGCRRFLRSDRDLHLVDSRDGLLLFARGQRSFVICNPATRQWVGLGLPLMSLASVVACGVYLHRPSGEHRLLFIGSSNDMHCYYVFSMGGGGGLVRRLGPVAGDGKRGGIPSACVGIGGTLHWSHHPEAGASRKMVAFDTASETFRLIEPPPMPIENHHLALFDMDGTLAMSTVAPGSPRRMDIWALEEAEGQKQRWTCRHRVDLPPRRLPRPPLFFQPPPSDEAVAVVEGRVLVVVGSGWVLLYDTKEDRTLSEVDHSGDIGNVTRCLYRPSLVPLQGPHAQPLPFRISPGGEPLLRYCPPDDPYMSLFGSDCGTWVVSNAPTTYCDLRH